MHGSRFEIRDPESTGSRILNLGGVSASACALCGCESARLKFRGQESGLHSTSKFTGIRILINVFDLEILKIRRAA